MFHKVQLQLTLYTGGIIAVLLFAAAGIYLHISGSNLTESHRAACQDELYTIAANLSSQPVVTHEWLSSLERSGEYLLSLRDNGVRFLYDQLDHNDEREVLTDAAWTQYDLQKDSLEAQTISYNCRYYAFSCTDDKGIQTDAFLLICDSYGSLELLLLAPTANLQHSIIHQRVMLFGILAAALLVLCVLDWFFIGKLLAPIEESRRRQNRFVAAASHELRTPLAVILSCSEELLTRKNASELQQLKVIHDEAQRMSGLVGNLLTLSAQERGENTLNLEPTNADTLALNAYETFESMARQKDLTFTVRLPEESLPQLICDRAKMEQLLAILLHNAISYTPAGGEITLSLRYESGNHTFTFSVADTGAGIPDSEKEKIFEPFYRSENARSTKGHYGLGLSIAKGIVSAHNGELRVRDRGDGRQGSVFEAILPASLPQAPAQRRG